MDHVTRATRYRDDRRPKANTRYSLQPTTQHLTIVALAVPEIFQVV